MSIEGSKNNDYKPLTNLNKAGGNPPTVQQTLRPANSWEKPLTDPSPSLVNPGLRNGSRVTPEVPAVDEIETSVVDHPVLPAAEISSNKRADQQRCRTEGRQKSSKSKTKHERSQTVDQRPLAGTQRASFYLYSGLYLFSILVLFRPYELIPGLSFLSATAFYFAIATLAIFIPSQLATEGNLTMLSTEVKAILAMTVIALVNDPDRQRPGPCLGQNLTILISRRS